MLELVIEKHYSFGGQRTSKLDVGETGALHRVQKSTNADERRRLIACADEAGDSLIEACAAVRCSRPLRCWKDD